MPIQKLINLTVISNGIFNNMQGYINKKKALFLLFQLLVIFVTANHYSAKEPQRVQSQENSNANKNQLEEKNILVLVFPGGKSHNFVMKELFEYSLKNSKKYKFNYHILVHNWDKDVWNKYADDYKSYGFGDKAQFDEIFNSALELVRIDPAFGYTRFNKAMIHILNQFMTSGLLEDVFRKIKFDMIITDIPNFLSKFLRGELHIPLSMYLSPPALPNIFYGFFEMNPATLPAIGTPFTDDMTFFQRLQNSVYMIGTKIMFKIFMGEQASVFKNYGYNYSDTNVFLENAMILLQYPPGVGFSFSKPPNMIFLNYITPKDAKELEDKSISQFLDKYTRNIYMSQGTIMKNLNFDNIMKIFEHYSDVGFILSIKKEISDKHNFPANVYLTTWVNQNDLLGDKRIHLFITHSGINSVLEAIYHEKPVIALGVSLDQVNTAGMVKTRETGVVFTSVNQLTPENLIPAIYETLSPNNKYLNNTKKCNKLIRMNEPATQTYLYWLEYGFDLGYDHLLVKAYQNLNAISLNNYDIGFVIILTIIFFLFLIKQILKCLFCRRQKEEKAKQE